ncbi:UDP-glycosyltransferase protein [Vigna angularis]|uniref:UDP-glycosyltransferase protein n=1 Tax=Phaseolus angularis TaxID=3914 RepID=A0A8T0LD25_PHAAN|nr:UDP-glycosyltransferase protein [Vigna angularis]
MKVAVIVAIGENGLVERGEIARVVKMVMEGEEGKELLHRMKQLKAVAATTLRDEKARYRAISLHGLKHRESHLHLNGYLS